MKRGEIVFILFLILIVIFSEPSSAVIITNLTILDNANGCAPSWSPDGKKVAFGNGFDIWVIDTDNTNLTSLTSNLSSFDWTAAWSPDGKKIAFMSSRSGNFDIWVTDCDGTNTTQLTTGQSDEGYPAFSPDGKKIAFYSGRSKNWDIWVLDIQNGNLTQLTFHPKNDMQPAWSPDGKKIAFASFRGSKIDTDIWVMGSDGSNLTQLTNDPAHEDHPTWSPDGTMIAFRSTRSKNPDIWVMNSDGKNQTQLTTDPAVDECCAWGPDGKIAFGSKRSGRVNVWIAEIDVNETLPLGPSPVSITITSDPPNVDLYVDGRPEGRTPEEVRIIPGTHQIKLVRTGFDDKVIDVEILAGETKNVSVSLTPASKSPRVLSFLAISVMIGLMVVVLFLIMQKKG